MKRFSAFMYVLSVLLVLPLLSAAAPVGTVTALEGNVDIASGEKAARNAKLGDSVSVGDILRAKSKSRAEVTFQDGNILRLAESTRVRITEYQAREGSTTTLELFRGKTQNIVSGLARDARYEVRTPNAVVGVRGTNFIAFFQNGVSGFLPREGTIYGYNRAIPQEVRVVTPGQAIMVFAVDRPAVIQPATAADVNRHLKDTTPGEKREGKEKEDDPPGAQSATPSPPPTVPAIIPAPNVTTINTTTVATTALPTFSAPLTEGRLTKIVTGSIKGSLYSSLYRIPAGAATDAEFYRVAGNDFLRVRYESGYFDDGSGGNRGFGFERVRYVPPGSPSVHTQEMAAWYSPDRYFLSLGRTGDSEGVRGWGRTSEEFPNLNLSAAPTDGGGATGTHPLFTGTLGNAANFPADYSPGFPGTGTFIKTLDYTVENVTSQTQIGTFAGSLAFLGSDPLTLWSASSPSAPVGIALQGAPTPEAGGEGSAFRGNVGFSSLFQRYAETARGYGASCFGRVAGHLPAPGGTRPLEANLYALYIYNPEVTRNRVGIMTGSLLQGAGTTVDSDPGTWLAAGTMNRLPELEIDNATGITAANLAENIVEGRAAVEATAGLADPTGPAKPAKGAGYGFITSLRGIDSFGIFSFGHNLPNIVESTVPQTTWESRGWGEFGRYRRTDDPSQEYRDYGFWHAALDDTAWAAEGLSAGFHGRFLTLLKYGTMNGRTLGTYGDGGLWSADSQGYWQKSGELAFASEIRGPTFRPHRQWQESFSRGNSLYHYTIADPQGGSPGWGGHSTHYDAVTNTTTIQNFDFTGKNPQQGYVKETWTTTDNGATWSYTATRYPDEAAYRAAIAGLSTPPPGAWTPDSAGDRYALRYGTLEGIMGGLNANIWTDKKSPLLFQGQMDIAGGDTGAPALSFGEIVSVNPLATDDAFANSALKIGGAFRGTLGFAVDSVHKLTGSLLALYQDAGGAGVLYSNDLTGSAYPRVGGWDASGTIAVYPLTPGPLSGDPKLFAQSVRRSEGKNEYASGEVRVDVVSGSGGYDKRREEFTTLAIAGQPWSIWNSVSVGTSAGTIPGQWTERHENERSVNGGIRSTYANVRMDAPLNGISSGTTASARVFFDEPDQQTGAKESYTVVLGGAVKGLFDPATTPQTWMSIAQGGAMETVPSSSDSL